MLKETTSLVSVLGLILALSPTPSHAATSTGALAVTAVVTTACAVVAAPLVFGIYDPTSPTALEASTTLTVLCTVGTPYTVGLNEGAAPDATVTTRQMTGADDYLSYGLYQNDSHTINWGNTPLTDTPASTTAGLLPTVFDVYGQIPSGQNVAPGPYVDNVTVTVNY